MKHTTRTTWGILALLLAGCAPETLDGDGAATLESTAAPATITFGADWSQRVTGTITAGSAVRINYATARLSRCRGETNNSPAWAIGGYFRVNGGVAQSFGVAPTSAQTPSPVTITLPNTPGTLELWFQNTNRWGCNAWDSNYGRNYTFTVARDPRAPGWIGDGASVISRATCGDGLPCDRDRRPLTTTWTYETYARQRAAIRVVTFDVWKEAVTDRDNPDLWRQLDVRMYSRFGSAGPFRMQYVNFDRRVGNNARYAVDLRGVDPIPDSPAGTPCPSVPLAPTPDGAYVSTLFEYYFTVNGVEYRPSSNGVFQGVFSNYRMGRLDACLPR